MLPISRYSLVVGRSSVTCGSTGVTTGSKLLPLLLLVLVLIVLVPVLTSSSPTCEAFFVSPNNNADNNKIIMQLQQSRFTQVISDVDDTLKSSGGVKFGDVALGGIDVQYSRGEIYPGVSEFYLELSRYGISSLQKTKSRHHQQQQQQQQTPAKIAILTARAMEFKSILEIKPNSKLAVSLRTAGEKAGIQDWGIGPVLFGSVAEWIIQDRKGLRKFTNFERLLLQDPTGLILQYIYVGDVGESDQEAGETMLREYPELVKAVFLHAVTDQADATIIIPSPKFINGRPVVFFRTYVGAAVDAVNLGFMDVHGLKAVIDAAVEKLSQVDVNSDKWVDLRKDLSRADILFETIARG